MTQPPRNELPLPAGDVDHATLIRAGVTAFTTASSLDAPQGRQVARCSLVTHQLGWELRLFGPELMKSQVCRSLEEITETHEKWKSELLADGWS